MMLTPPPTVQFSTGLRDRPHFAGDATPIRIEAASYGGKPVWFKVIGPWASAAAPAQASSADQYVATLFSLLTPAALLAAGLFARRNVLRGRGDRKTAIKLGLFCFVSMMIAHVFRVDHLSDAPREYELVDRGLANATWLSVQIWLMYLALEPFVRRQWPHMLIGWTRLFAGRFRDPMLGRDLLVGLSAGSAIASLGVLPVHAPSWFGLPKLQPVGGLVSALIDSRHLVYAFAAAQISSVWIALFVLFLLLRTFAVFRRRWAAVLVVGMVVTFGFSELPDGPLFRLGGGLVVAVILLSVLLRLGLLPTVLAIFVSSVLRSVPFTLDPEPWYFGRSLFFIALFVAAAVYAFWSALGEKKAFGMPVLEEA